MENNRSAFSLKKCFHIAKGEYVKWICNPKLTLFAIMFLYIYDAMITKMVQAANDLNTELMVLEPFIAICNSSLLLLVLPSVYIGLMGDFPRLDGNSMFYLQRCGKQNWMIGQLLFSVFASFTYLFLVFLASAGSIFFRCTYENRWSDVTTKYVKYFPEQSESMVAKLIDGRLYNNLKPVSACLLSFALMLLFLVLISMMLMSGFVIGKHAAGIAVTAALVCIGTAIVQFRSSFYWLFPTAHVLLWTHFDEIYKYQVFPIACSFLCLLVLIVLFYLISFLRIDRYDFSKIADMED